MKSKCTKKKLKKPVFILQYQPLQYIHIPARVFVEKSED